MTDPMTLTERLRNPQWVALPEADRIMLDVEYTTKTMTEAADTIGVLLASLKVLREIDDAYGFDLEEFQRDQMHDAIAKGERA